MNEEFWNQSSGLIGGAAGVVAFLFLLGFLRMLLKVSTPNKLIVVTGRKRKSGGKTMGYSVERGSSLVIPFLQAADYLSLDVFPINVRVDGVNSANGITLGADATACVCIDDSNEDMLYAAARADKRSGTTNAGGKFPRGLEQGHPLASHWYAR